MILSKETLSKIPASPGLVIPQENLLNLPERVLQFGTGVLLRGLPNYFVDKANRKGVFNGRILVVKSTDKGSSEAFDKQNGMYTLCIRGLENGKQVDEKIITSAISRVVSARQDWNAILEAAVQPELQVVFSNTTEVGIVLDKEDKITHNPPASFPGKLLAVLKKRYDKFNGTAESGMVIVPTELVVDNGVKLKNICLELARLNNLDAAFITWLETANDFCNTLVDRIVPGALPAADHAQMQKELGYTDELMIMAEPYTLWAIETSNPRTKEILSFAQVDAGVVLADNINKHREIKLRLLNAPHTFSCALALWSGFPIVKEAMENQAFKKYISALMLNEIVPTISGSEISEEEARVFAGKVIDRFANPFIAHEWLNISAQYTLKMASRCIPLLLNYHKKTNTLPQGMVLGLAAYLLFMNAKKNEQGQFVGTIHGKDFVITDDKASILYAHWQKGEIQAVVSSALSDASLWNTDLTTIQGLDKAVLDAIALLKSKGSDILLQKEFSASK